MYSNTISNSVIVNILFLFFSTFSIDLKSIGRHLHQSRALILKKLKNALDISSYSEGIVV